MTVSPSSSCASVSSASQADASTVQGAAALLMQKKAMQMDQSAAAQLVAALPDPPLATSGGVGTLVNTYA